MENTELKRNNRNRFNENKNDYESNHNPSKLSRVSANKFNQAIEDRTKRLASKLNKIIIILLVLIVITYLILFFVNF